MISAADVVGKCCVPGGRSDSCGRLCSSKSVLGSYPAAVLVPAAEVVEKRVFPFPR